MAMFARAANQLSPLLKITTCLVEKKWKILQENTYVQV